MAIGPIEKSIDAMPTKDFFISMLVKDIELVPAIVDLIDNSLDGARRAQGDGRLDDYWVRLHIDPQSFRIADNCGGIPVDVARDYAFRFGRPSHAPDTGHSVGRFGVGMKRALFKLGRVFTVESATAFSRFTVKVDVDQWRREPNQWTFAFDDVHDNIEKSSPDDQGTSIEVHTLHPNVSADFAQSSFSLRLRSAIEQYHSDAIHRGLAISVNEVPINAEPMELLVSPGIRPAYEEFSTSHDHEGVTVKVYAGVAESDPHKAGWYIFCNGRMVVGADKSEVTGWRSIEDRMLPKYHNQFARFRGYAFFDSDNASLLPWTTTKTGVDSDSDLYRSVRQKMANVTRPVITFLNRLDAEVSLEESGPYTQLIDDAEPRPVSELSPSATFAVSVPTRPKQTTNVARIKYERPRDVFEIVKKQLKASSNKEVGEKTFDYYFESECDDL